MIRRGPLALLATLAAFGITIGTGAASGTHHPAKCRPTKRHRCPPPPCHPRAHHRCPAKHKKPAKPPPPPPPPLPRRLEVDENDQGALPQPYSLLPSHNPVGTGTVQFNVYNFGQDAHTFAIVDSWNHQLALVQAPANQPQTAVLVSVDLPPGRYTLECTLPGHAALGMVATLTVK